MDFFYGYLFGLLMGAMAGFSIAAALVQTGTWSP